MPTMLSQVVNRFQLGHAPAPTEVFPQEQDAQEFLLYLLEQIEVELLSLRESLASCDGELRDTLLVLLLLCL